MGLLDNVIIPEVWNADLPFTIPEKSKFFRSGAVFVDRNSPFNQAGILAHTPFMIEPTADMEAPSTGALTPNELTQSKDIMVCFTRQVDFTVTKQKIRRMGSDLGQMLYNNVAEYTAKQYEKYAFKILKAIYGTGGTLYDTHTHDPGTNISFDEIFTTKAKLGDVSGDLKYSAYHSAVVNKLRQKGMVEDIPVWKENQIINGTIEKVAGLPIIETDLMPTTTDTPAKYYSFLMAPNSIYFANPYIAVEDYYVPNTSGGLVHIILTADLCIHVPGVKYNLTAQEPTDVQLAASATWSKVADHDKDIKLVSLLTTVA